MRAIAVVVSIALLGCFPHNKPMQRYSKYAEGGAIVSGIGLEFLANTGADCDTMGGPGSVPSQSCHSRATLLGDVGVGLMLAGLLGFVATVSTDETDKEDNRPKVEIKADKPAEKPDVKLPPGVKAPEDKPADTTPTAAATAPGSNAP